MSTLMRPDRILRLPEIKRLTGLSRSAIYEKMKHNTFPRSRKLGAKTVSWRLSQVDEWIADPR